MYLEALASGGSSDWFYTVILKAPLGADITLDDNDEEVNAVGTGDYIGIPVHNASSTYAITVEANGFQRTGSVTSGATSGGMSNLLDYSFGEIDLTIDTEFNGVNATVTDGTSTATVALPATGTSAVIYVPNTGNWTISATDPVSGNTFNSSPNPVPVLAIGTPVSAGLYVIPDGSTVTPTDNIATWLLCADIKDKSYTTLEEVLADEETLRRLLTSDNANNYLVRSKTWSVNPGLVPTMLGPTVPSGEASADSSYTGSFYPYYAFDKDDTTRWNNGQTVATGWVAYDFGQPKCIKKASVKILGTTYPVTDAAIEGYDGTNWQPIYSIGSISDNDIHYYEFADNTNSYNKYRFIATGTNNKCVTVYELQFYGLTESIPENAKAMEIIGQDDYAANTLLGDSDWREALCGSEYYESVLNTTVPLMTANDAPEGLAFASTEMSATYKAYKAFNNDDRGWVGTSGIDTGSYVGYTFLNKLKCYFAKAWLLYQNAAVSVGGKIQGSDDGFVSDEHDVSDNFTCTSNSSNTPISSVFTQNIDDYDSYRFICTTPSLPSNTQYGLKLRFYGRQASGVQTLLKAAGITNKPYLTIEEVLADHEVVQKIMHSHNAVDYLVTAKLFIDAFTSDAFAMRCIGLRNYAADTLLADDEWCEGIGGSDYVDFVLNFKTPAMTSATTPSGTVTASGVYSTNYAYTCVGRTGHWQSNTTQGVVWIDYEFVDEFEPIYFKTSFNHNYYADQATLTVNFQGYDSDTGVWDNLGTQFTVAHLTNVAQVINTSGKKYKKYRLHITTSRSITADVYYWYIYGRTDVDETKIQVYSAANDSFSLQDPSTGSLSPIDTTDGTGHVEIAKTAIPNGRHTLYSGVAKNPNKLTDDYFKRVNVDDWTSIIELMPDDALYWYGYESPDLEDMSTANGWTGNGSYPITTPTHNTRDILLPYYNASSYCGVGMSKGMNEDAEYESLVEGITFASGNAGQVGYSPSKLVGGTGCVSFYDIPDVNIIHKVSGDVPKGSYPWVEKTGPRDTKIHGAWLNRESQTPTFLSAANDVLYILDGARQIPIAITNAEGKSYDPMLAPGTYTIYSSVAKDPNSTGLSDPFCVRNVVVTADTRCIKVMPEGEVLYWYGYKSDNLEALTTANGWYASGIGAGTVEPVFYTNYMSIYNPSSAMGGVGTKNPVKCTTMHVISREIDTSDPNCGIFITSTKDIGTTQVVTPISTRFNDLRHYQLSASSLGTYYLCEQLASTRTFEQYAFWYE